LSDTSDTAIYAPDDVPPPPMDAIGQGLVTLIAVLLLLAMGEACRRASGAVKAKSEV
jgi:hypothetical protein